MVGGSLQYEGLIKKVTALERLRIIGLSLLWRIHLTQFLALESLFSPGFLAYKYEVLYDMIFYQDSWYLEVKKKVNICITILYYYI